MAVTQVIQIKSRKLTRNSRNTSLLETGRDLIRIWDHKKIFKNILFEIVTGSNQSQKRRVSQPAREDAGRSLIKETCL